MAVKDTFLSATILVKIAVIVALVANLFNWISFTTSSWYHVGTLKHVGLWRICRDSCYLLDGPPSDDVGANQAFAVLGFVSQSVGLLLLVLFLFWERCKGNSEIRWAAAILFIISAITWLISVIIFAAKIFDDAKSVAELGYSFALAIVSLFLSLVSGILLVIEASGKGSIGQK